MRITADSLRGFGLVDDVLSEPLGGAHRKPEDMAEVIRNAIIKHLDELEQIPIDQLLELRRRRLASYGQFKEA
jgi:acetyl-CoA carboxylase carboxyl transferase subunit alpha